MQLLENTQYMSKYPVYGKIPMRCLQVHNMDAIRIQRARQAKLHFKTGVFELTSPPLLSVISMQLWENTQFRKIHSIWENTFVI